MGLITMIKEKIATGFPHKTAVSTPHQVAIARGVDKGIRSWLKTFVFVGRGVGLIGSGVASGIYAVPSNAGLMVVGLKAGGMRGSLLSDLTVSLTRGVSGVYQLSGVSSVVGSGSFTGSGQGMGSEELLYVSIRGCLLSEGVVGSFDMSRGISKGVINLMRSGIVKKGLIKGAVGSASSSGRVALSIGV